MSLFRIIYKSVPTIPISDDFLFSIFGSSEKFNVKEQVTGLLLATNKHFLQVIEGDKRVLNELYHNISKDTRHDQIDLLSFEMVETRVFSEWSMKILKVDDLHKELRNMIVEKFGKGKRDFCLPDDPFLAFSLLYDVYSFAMKSSF